MLRRALLPVSLLATALLLASCSSPQAAAESESDNGGAVTFAHPSIEGLEIDFDAQPETLVMDCYSYGSLHEYGIEPDALFGYECDSPFVMGDIDISGIEIVGQDGEINIEKLAELRPDAIIGNGDANGWSWFDEDVNSQLTRVAPFIPLPSAESIDEGIANTRELAEFLGADVKADAITAADADFEAAKDDFAAAVEGRELNFLLTSPTKEMLYTGVGFPQADLLEELGANIIGAEAPATGNPWGQVAWEDAASYPADVILIESYDESFSFTADLWESLPAVKADQLASWGSKGALTTRAYADWLNGLTESVESFEKVS